MLRYMVPDVPEPPGSVRGRAAGLINRQTECLLLDQLLAAVRGGESRALVLYGEPGVGKTELLEYLLGRASEARWRVMSVAGVESEMELAFASLHQLCTPFLDHLSAIPKPQQDALSTTFGLIAGPTPDRFLVGLAVLSLLAEAAAEAPLLCTVDDSQWLDGASAQVLAFVARRLGSESVAMVFAARVTTAQMAGLPNTVVEGLADEHALALLGSVVPGPVDPRVRDEIVAETRGNPLALLELPRGMTAAQLAGGFGIPGALGLPVRIEESFLGRVKALPPEARRLLLLAAAEPLGDSALLWRAASRVGIIAAAAPPLEDAGLIVFGTRSVSVTHWYARRSTSRPRLTRGARCTPPWPRSPTQSSILTAAPGTAPRPRWGPTRTSPPNSSGRRTGPDTWGASCCRSVLGVLRPPHTRPGAPGLAHAGGGGGQPPGRGVREGPRATHHGGGRAARRLCQRPSRPAARPDRVRHRSRQRRTPQLLKAAKRLEPFDLDTARDTYLGAWGAALFAGRLAGAGDLAEVSRAALDLPMPAQPRALDLLLEGLALLITDGRAAAAPRLRQAARTFASADVAVEERLRGGWLAHVAAAELWDEDTWHAITVRQTQVAREVGALEQLALDLNSQAMTVAWRGDFPAAASLIAEADAACEATGSRMAPYAKMFLAALRGSQAEVAVLTKSALEEAATGGQGVNVPYANWVTAILCNGLGRYEEALAAALQATEYIPELFVSTWAVPDLIEAAVRAGNPKVAGDALERLSETARAGGTEHGLGLEARSLALLSEGEAADRSYRTAIDRLSRTQLRPELARAHLLYGEWLRRQRRRSDARDQLRTASEMFEAIGMEAFAERARRELRATGETARRRSAETHGGLTAQEAQIATMARDGLSNAEISTRLFISVYTVDYHLRKVFSKLGITRRSQIVQALPPDPGSLLVS